MVVIRSLPHPTAVQISEMKKWMDSNHRNLVKTGSAVIVFNKQEWVQIGEAKFMSYGSISGWYI